VLHGPDEDCGEFSPKEEPKRVPAVNKPIVDIPQKIISTHTQPLKPEIPIKTESVGSEKKEKIKPSPVSQKVFKGRKKRARRS